MLTKQNPQTYTKYKCIFAIYTNGHTHTYITHTQAHSQIYTHRSQSCTHFHNQTQAFTHRDMHLQVYHIKHRHIHTPTLKGIYSYKHLQVHSYKAPFEARTHTNLYTYMATTHIQCYIKHICSYHKHTHTISPSSLEPCVGGHIAGPHLWWVWAPDR